MKLSLTSSIRVFQLLGVGGLFLLFATNHSYAQRTERARDAVRRAQEERASAKVWARQRGLEMRHDNGLRVLEIMAVRNGRPIYYTTQNDAAAISTSANLVRNTVPYNLTGSDVHIGIWDGGSVMTNHQEFGNRVVSVDGADRHYHATHVGGTIGATGVVARSTGMAPNVMIRSYDWNNDESEMIASAASLPGEAGKVSLSNHSYGILTGWFFAGFTNPWTRRSGYHWWGDLAEDSADEFFGQYGYGPRLWDQIVYDAPYFLPFKAAGNERDDGPSDGNRVYFTPDNGDTWTNTIYDSTVHALGDGIYKNGYDTVPYLGTAKNIITVGAVHDAEANGMRELSNAALTVFTSWGPADDGRIKPDIVANGADLYSCNIGGVASYASRSGTSMSTPNACGSAALLVDYYDDLFPGDAMRASSLKGLILHTADDLGRPGPDYQYGWGLMNTLAAVELLKEYADGNLIKLKEESVSPANPVQSYTAYADGGSAVKVSLCWTDPPGTSTSANDSRAPVLVNDLDLVVTGPNGIHYPYTLNYLTPEANAVTDEENNVDNIEQIYIEAPLPGTYTISIDYDGVLENGEQVFSLITSGLVSDEDGDGLPDLWENGFFLNTTGAVASADMDGDGYDNLEEYIAGSDPLDPTSAFRFTSEYALPSTGHPPYVVEWNSIPGRVYNVSWTYHLKYVPYTEISGDIRWPINSYTDTVERIEGFGQYYRIQVRMDD